MSIIFKVLVGNGKESYYFSMDLQRNSSNMLKPYFRGICSHAIRWMYTEFLSNLPGTFIEFFFKLSSRNVKMVFRWIGNSRNTSITITTWLLSSLEDERTWLSRGSNFSRRTLKKIALIDCNCIQTIRFRFTTAIYYLRELDQVNVFILEVNKLWDKAFTLSLRSGDTSKYQWLLWTS